jgi:cyclopropane-fatty-acyl-phospholipid synthase
MSKIITKLNVKAQPSAKAKTVLTELLALADVHINGDRDWDIQVHDDRVYARMMKDSSLGMGEAYMDGWWDCPKIDEMITRILKAGLEEKIKGNWRLAAQVVAANMFNLQSRRRSVQVADAHYNLDNDMYAQMLGPTMSYTCAYFKGTQDLDRAQDNKHDLVCKKLGLKKGDQVLELGCGWGGFAEFACKNYGVTMTSINVSEAQVKYARERTKGLDATFHLCDYRDTDAYNPEGTLFDKVVSIGMCEHVGHKNYDALFGVAAAQLKDEGLFLLHTIGGNVVKNSIEPWHGKYIFPNGMLPAIRQLAKAFEGKLIMEDWHNFGACYDKTLMAWHENFIASWPTLKTRFDERFYRMFTFYLLSCAGLFRAREAQLWQIVLSKGGVTGGYVSVR